MKLQTEIKLKKQEDNQIDYHSKLLLLGSCFSENIGEKFDYFKFQSVSNPFGILFHPKAIGNLVVRAVQQEEYSENDVFYHNEQWHCYDAHSRLSNTSKIELLQTLNKGLQLTNKQIIESTHIVVTLGTAWVYNLVESDKTVANCHKVPQKQFSKKLLSVETIFDGLNKIVNTIQSVNDKTAVIFTVSPVRHVKDGFIENMQSKSHLITAIHQLVTSMQRLFYFPSYEIMMDELRDYRFYKQDMLHPNDTAVKYIWEKFDAVWIDKEAKKTMDQVDVIQKGLIHRPTNSDSEAHKLFLKTIGEKIKLVQQNHPDIVF